jgi:hypothetical protein
MSEAVYSQARSSVRTKSRSSQPDAGIVPTAARDSGSARRQPSQYARSVAASDLTMLLDADAVDLRDVGDAIRVYPELQSLVLKLCEFLALSPGVRISSVEEAAIVLGKDRLRIVVHAWSVNQDAVSFENSTGENCRRRLDLELRQVTHLSNLLVRDLLSLVSLVNPADLSPEQEAMLQHILQAQS